MSRGKLTFTQRDVVRAIRAAKAAGIGRVEIARDGTIAIVLDAEPTKSAENPLDDDPRFAPLRPRV